MNFLRFLLRVLLVVAVAAVFGALALLTPPLQTWLAQRQLHQRLGPGATIDSFWMGFGELDVENARWERDGVALTVPTLEAKLPVSRAFWNRQLAVKSLSAKGWTLDLSGRGAAPPPPAADTAGSGAPAGQSAPAPIPEPAKPAAPPLSRIVVEGLRLVLSDWPLPMDATIDGIELEGDIVVNAGAGSDPVPIHVKAHGGGFSAGGPGELTVEAEAAFLDADAVPLFYNVRSRIRGAITPVHSLAGTEVNADVTVKGGSLAAEALEFSLQVARDASAPGGDRYAVGLLRGGRPLVSSAVAYRKGTDRLEGTWAVQLSEPEMAALGPLLPVAGGALAGEGNLDADAALNRVHASGRLRGTGERLTAFSLPLDRFGVRGWEVDFDATDEGAALRLTRLQVSLLADRPVVAARSLQPVTFSRKTNAVEVPDPKADVAEMTVEGLALNGLPATPGGFAMQGARVSGGVRISRDERGWRMQTSKPLEASGSTLRRGEAVLGRDLELTADVSALWSDRERTVRLSPLIFRRAGRDWIRADATVTKAAAPAQPLSLAAKLDVDLRPFAEETRSPLLQALEVNRMAGDISVTFGELTRIAGNLTGTGTDPERRLASAFSVDTDRYGGVAFHLPLTLTWGARVSDIAADGTWTPPSSGNPVNLRLSAKHADLEQLRWLAGPLAVLVGGGATPQPETAAGTPMSAGKDDQPFWGRRPGQIMLGLDQLQAGEDLLKEVRGSMTLDARGVQLKYGGYLAPDGNLTPLEGELRFDPAAADPYALRLTFDPVTVDAAPLFGKPAEGQDAVFHGKFSVTSTVVGNGKTLADLLGRTEQEYRLSSQNGIVRLLKTHVTVTGPEASKPLADTAGRVGSALGSFFGAKGLNDSGARKVNPTTQAVFDLSYGVAEIGYKDLSLTARRGAEGDVRIADLVMTAERSRLRGNGRMTPIAGKPLRAWPFSVELTYAAHAEMADILAKTGLPVGAKDKDGWVELTRPFHFAGTLQAVDTSEWRDLLLKAAEKPMEGKK